jgi:hypothetical protein
MRRGRLGVALGATMAVVLALGFGVAQAAPIPEITFDPTSSAAACFNCPAGGPFAAAASIITLTYSGSTWGGQTTGGFLAIGDNAATPNVNNLGSLALATSPSVYPAGTTLRLQVTFVLDPPGVILPGNSPEFTAEITGAVSGGGLGGIFVDFDNTPQAFTYSAPGEQGNFSFRINDVNISAGGIVPLTGQVTGGSSSPGGNVPEPGVTLLLGSVLAALAFVGHRAARSR